MKIVRNNIIPFKGFVAINILGVLFVRKDAVINEKIIRHEAIHTAQMKELFYVPFYALYVLEWLIKLIYYRNGKKAYRAISFEREAYEHEDDLYYLEER